MLRKPNKLVLAVESGSLEKVTQLLSGKKKPDINGIDTNGKTPLTSALSLMRAEIVHCLVDAKASVNSTDGSGRTPLMYSMDVAVKNNDLSLLNYLLDRKADPNIPNLDGQTPLVLISRHRQSDPIVAALLAKNANPQAANKSGLTALYYAAFVGSQKSVKQLLEAKADPLVANSEGLTALHCAVKHAHVGVVEELLKVRRTNPHIKDHKHVTPKNSAEQLIRVGKDVNKKIVELFNDRDNRDRCIAFCSGFDKPSVLLKAKDSPLYERQVLRQVNAFVGLKNPPKQSSNALQAVHTDHQVVGQESGFVELKSPPKQSSNAFQVSNPDSAQRLIAHNDSLSMVEPSGFIDSQSPRAAARVGTHDSKVAELGLFKNDPSPRFAASSSTAVVIHDSQSAHEPELSVASSRGVITPSDDPRVTTPSDDPRVTTPSVESPSSNASSAGSVSRMHRMGGCCIVS